VEWSTNNRLSVDSFHLFECFSQIEKNYGWEPNHIEYGAKSMTRLFALIAITLGPVNLDAQTFGCAIRGVIEEGPGT